MPSVLEEQQRLPIFDQAGKFLNEIVGEPIGEDQIEIAVVVVVEKLQPPSAHPPCGHANAEGHGDIIERQVFIVLVERENFFIDIGDEQIHPAIFVEIGGVHAHSRTRTPFGAVSNIGLQSKFVELPWAAIHKEKICDRVVGDEKVHQAIVVDVGGDDAKSFAWMSGNARLFADVGEGSVAIIVKEKIGHGTEDSRNAVMPLAVGRDTAAVRRVKIHKVANEKVEPAIVVVIEPNRARGPPWHANASLFGDVRKRAVAIVVVENALSILRHVKIGEAVAVIIADRDSLAVPSRGYARLLRDIGKRAVAVVRSEE